MSAPPAAPLILASTSPRRREILEQLRIPFVVVPPAYEEAEGDPVAHAIGKAESVLAEAGDQPVLGCDTEVVCEGDVYGKPESEADAEAMLESLAGKTHEVVSGLALITPGWREVHREVTRVTFRPLDARDLAHYLASREWEGRAGAYAIQGLGASLVERIEGDYLNVVGLPGRTARAPARRAFPRRLRLRLSRADLPVWDYKRRESESPTSRFQRRRHGRRSQAFRTRDRHGAAVRRRGRRRGRQREPWK